LCVIDVKYVKSSTPIASLSCSFVLIYPATTKSLCYRWKAENDDSQCIPTLDG